MNTASQEQEEQSPPKRMSKGEKLFNWLVYGGIAGVGAFAAALPVAYWGKYGKGVPLFKRMSKSLENVGMSAATAEDVLMTTALMQGGNLAIIPVKMAENNKPELVEKFNEALGEPSHKEAIEKAPKQTWGSLIKSRVFLAWFPVFFSFRGAASAFPQAFETFTHKFAENAVCKPLGKPTHMAGVETKAFRYGKLFALDIFATAAASALLYLGSRIFAKQDKDEPISDILAEDVKAAFVLDEVPKISATQKPQSSHSAQIAAKRLQDTGNVRTLPA